MIFETWVNQFPPNIQNTNIRIPFTGSVVVGWEGRTAKIQRSMLDYIKHVVIGYTMTIELMAETDNYRATFSDFNVLNDPDIKTSEGWEFASPKRYPNAQILGDGDTIALDLYSDSSTGYRSVDYIRFSKDKRIVLREGMPRDVRADSGEFEVAGARLRVDGLAVMLVMPQNPLHGRDLWLYVPGYGRYSLSFKPHSGAGFELAGNAVGNALVFTVHGNVFRIDCSGRIPAAGSGNYNVYARWDPKWTPKDSNVRDQATFGIDPGAE